MTKKTPQHAVAVTEEFLTKIARIIGPASAAADALLEMQRRRDRGDDEVHCVQYGNTFFVGSKKASPQTGPVSDRTAPNTDETRPTTADAPARDNNS